MTRNLKTISRPNQRWKHEMNEQDVPHMMKKWLKDLIRIDTQNPPGRTKEAVDYLLAIAKDLGNIRTKVLPLDEDRHSIIWEVGDERRKKIVLCGHLDTVPIGSSEFWNFDPLSAETLDANKIGGRGAADMKAGIVAIIGAISYLLDEIDDLPWQIIFAGTADEEVSMKGARSVRDEVMKNADYLIITEPTNGHIGIAEKGVLQLKVEFTGKAAHGSMPQLGINAIHVMSTFLNKLMGLQPDDVHALLGKTTFNIGRIQGGTKINIVADSCWSEIDIRFVPQSNPDEILDEIQRLTSQLNDDFGTSSQIKVIHRLQALETSRDHPMIRNLQEQGAKELIGLTYATDAAELLTGPYQNIPFVIFGPGDPAVIHKPNEHVSLEDTITTAKILANAIKNYRS